MYYEYHRNSLKVTMYFLEQYLMKAKQSLLPLNFAKRTEQGLTSGSDSVIVLFSTIACKILLYSQLVIAWKKYGRKWLEKTSIVGIILSLYDLKRSKKPVKLLFKTFLMLQLSSFTY